MRRAFCVLTIVAMGLGLLFVSGCAGKSPLVVKEPVVEPGPDGKLIPVKDEKGNQLYKETSVPGDAVSAWVQSDMAKQRKPYVEQTFVDGKLVGQNVWGENGRATYQDVDSDTVKIVRAVAGPGGAVAVAGIGGYFGWQNNKVQWEGLGKYLSNAGTPQSVNVEKGGVYNSGNFSGTLSTSFSLDDHSTVLPPATVE